MKKIIPKLLIIFIVVLCFGTTLTAQVGINNTIPDPSVILDITSTDKGILVPRMLEADRLETSNQRNLIALEIFSINQP